MKNLLYSILTSFLLVACCVNQSTVDKYNVKIENEKISNQYLFKEYGAIPSDLISAFQLISGKNQKFEIDNATSNTIVGEKGTILIIPEKSIVDLNGQIVKGKITIELKENFQIRDYITSNLQTVHNDQILESKGMIFFNAKDRDGKELKIADNTSIRIQIPQKDLKNDPSIFLGVREENGLLNWEQKKEPTKTLVPYPIKMISRNRYPTECFNNYGITKDTLNNYFNYYGDINEYENTLLATKEFSDRYHSTCWKDVLKIYIENLDKNLWEIDEMVLDYFIKDSIKSVDFQINNVYPGPNGGPPTKQQIESHDWLVNNAKQHGRWTIERYRYFASQKLTKIDLSKRIDATKLENINKAFISYDAMKFGWVNVDFFYEDPNAVLLKLSAITNQQAYIVNLLINGRNVMISGIEHPNYEFRFSMNSDGTIKLPKGEKATIIAIGFSENELQFGEKEIVIGANEIENINMKEVSGDKLKTILDKYGN